MTKQQIRSQRRRSVYSVGLASTLCLAISSVAFAKSPADSADTYHPISTLGSYLAGKIAAGQNDMASAARFYGRTLAEAHDHPGVIAAAFIAAASEGDTARADQLARRLIKSQPAHREARLWLGVSAFEARRFEEARNHFRRAASGPIAELTSRVASAWTALAQGRKRGAIERLKTSNRAEWAQYYADYHRALIADLTNRPKLSVANFRRVIERDPRTPRTTMAYASSVAARGQLKRAVDIMTRYRERVGRGGDPMSKDLMARLESGEPVTRMVASPKEGLAELFYGLGEALSTEGGATPLGVIYLRTALRLRPDFPFALAALANVYEGFKDYDRANQVYGLIKRGTPLDTAVEIRKALNLDAMDRVAEARRTLLEKLEADPKNVQAAEALANMLRGRKRFREAIQYYDIVIDQLGDDEAHHWVYWYARGTCYERIKNWPKAESDLLKAKSLNPNQALVLNYLGYSWVDQNQRLSEALQLIKKAVSLKPDDGYIVDSLGWAYFKLGNLPLALKYMERAVELKPQDPILNDHLGDVLWRMGHHREARFQWDLALSFNPEPEDIVKIQSKLRDGLPAPTPEVARTGRAKASGGQEPVSR
jgi:tetratricopeptide (TPR) repeat protein